MSDIRASTCGGLDVCEHRVNRPDRKSASASSSVDALESSSRVASLVSCSATIDARLSSSTHLHDSSVVDARWRSAHRDRVQDGDWRDWQYEVEERRDGSALLRSLQWCALYLGRLDTQRLTKHQHQGSRGARQGGHATI